MRWGISGAPIPAFVPFAEELEAACMAYPGTFPPCFLAAIKWNETGASTDPAIVSADGGHGILQLTATWPPNWADPRANADYALSVFLTPAIDYWTGRGFLGDVLIKCVAATYNAGLGAAIQGHDEGDVDYYTTNHYAARALANFHAFLNGVAP